MPHENRARVSRAPWRFLLAMVALLATAAGIALMTTGGASAATSAPISTPPPSSRSASPSVGPTNDLIPPSAPTNLAATATSTSITLTWTASRPGNGPVVGYRIGYFKAFDDVGYSMEVGNVTTATIPNRSPATEYRISVAAKDVYGYYGQSAAIVVVTPATDTGDTVPPANPPQLTLGQVTATTAALSWTPSTDNVAVTGYQVWRFDGVFVNTLVATVTGTSYTAPLVYSPTGSNQFYIRARDAAGNVSIASNLVSAKGLPSYSPSASPSRSNPPSPTLSCRVAYQVQSQWNTGFVAGITISNTGTAPVDGWVLTFTFNGDQRITNGWNGIIVQTGSAVSVTNYGWNSTIPANGSITVGFQGSWQTSNAAPSNFALNGVPCSTAV